MPASRHRHSFIVPFGDCDPAGLVFYPNFYVWMDEATWTLFRSVGITRTVINQTYRAMGFPLVSSSLEHRAPVHDGDTLTVESAVCRWGTSSFDVAHSFTCDGRPIAEGRETRVWAVMSDEDGVTVKAAPVPDDVKALLVAS